MKAHASIIALISTTFVGSALAQWPPPRLETKGETSPATLRDLEFYDYSPKLNRVRGRLQINSRQEIHSLTVLITYWKQGQPVGGQTRQVSKEALSNPAQVTLRLTNHSQIADLVQFEVIAASAPGVVWRNEAATVSGGGFDEDGWKRSEVSSFSSPIVQLSGCDGSAQGCANLAKDICGARGVGTVSYIGSTCSCCFSCSGEPAPDCGGDQ
jgi:hypothetical protein